MPISANTLELKRSDKEVRNAGIFALCLALLLMATIFVVMNNAPPIILGTEMNTNGLVEYLCLGNGCKNLHPMDW